MTLLISQYQPIFCLYLNKINLKLILSDSREKCLWSFCNERDDCDIKAPFYNFNFWMDNQQYLYQIVFAIYINYIFSLLGLLGIVFRSLVCLQLFTILGFPLFLSTLNECILNIYAAYLLDSGSYDRMDMIPPSKTSLIIIFIFYDIAAVYLLLRMFHYPKELIRLYCAGVNGFNPDVNDNLMRLDAGL